MASPTLTPNSREEQDDRYNPVLLGEEERQAFKGIESGYDKTADDSQENKNINTAKEAEENPNEIPFTGSGAQSQKQSLTGKFFGSIKKNSAVTAIIGALLTGGFGLSLLSPGLLLVHLKETMADKFNDQLTTMDIRQTAILKKKLAKTTTKGVCGSVVTLRCRYQTIGERHVGRLEKAGFTIEGDKNVLGRTKPTSFTFEGRSISASEMLNEARSNPSLRSALRHGYNPKFAAFSDAIAEKINSKLGLKKTKNITPSSDTERMRDQLVDNASGEAAAGDGKPSVSEDEDGKKVYKDVNGDVIDENSYNSLIDANSEIEARSGLADGVKKAGLKSGIKGALTATAFGAGAVDSLCTVWSVIRVAGFAAKVYGQRQLIRYSYQFMNTADAIKAGDATPEEVEYLSTILTSTNAEGRSATDSHGYRFAAFGDTFNTSSFDTSVKGDQLTDAAADKNVIQNETSKYVNGQIIPDNLLAKVVGAIGAANVSAADSTCHVVKSWQGQVGLFTIAIGGAVAAFFSGGGTLGIGAALQVAAGVTASVALAVITPKLIDMAKGELITGEENGNEAGNAITSGMGGYNSQTSQGRGLAVLSKEDAVEYAQATAATVADYNEVDRYEHSPFDATSKNTFIGGIVSSIIPYTSKLTASGSTITSLSSLVSHSFGSIVSPTSSAADMTAEELDACQDPEYAGLAADPFCNLRYGLSKSALANDPETVLDYMENGGYVEKDSEDGAPGGTNGAAYQDYINQCIERKSSIGDTFSSGDEGSGENCIQGRSGANEERNTMFRLFYVDTSVQDGMDSSFEAEGEETTPETASATQARVASFNIFHSADQAESVWKARLTRSMNVMADNSIDVAGFQEVRADQLKALQTAEFSKFTNSSGEDIVYETYPKEFDRSPNPIIWNSEKYSVVGNPQSITISYSGGKQQIPVLKMQDVSTGGQFYFINTHDPADSQGNAQDRLNNANTYVDELAKLEKDAIPIVFAGDFNSSYSTGGANQPLNGDRNNLVYCVVTKSGDFFDASDVYLNNTQKNISGACPRNAAADGASRPDHIFVSKDVSVTNFFTKPRGKDNGNGSDVHDTVIADIEIGGSNALGNVPDWTKLPIVNAPIGGPVSGNINVVSANIKLGSGVPSSLHTISGRNPDFITLNEVAETSLSTMVRAAPGYGAYRDPNPDRTLGGAGQSMNNVIMWKEDKWKLLDSGRMKITDDDMGYISGHPFTWDRYATWGVLQRNDGAIVSLISTHMMTNPKKFPKQHGNPPQSRVEQYSQSMDILLQLTAVLAQHGPVLVGGDMNSHIEEGEHTAAAKFKTAGFGYAKDSGVMHIFHPPGTKLVSHSEFSIPSDHPALQAGIDMNGVGPGAIKTVSLGGKSTTRSIAKSDQTWPVPTTSTLSSLNAKISKRSSITYGILNPLDVLPK